MSNVKMKAWGFIASCVLFVISLIFPCYKVVVEMDMMNPYVRTIRIGTKIIGLFLFLFAVWGIYIALRGQKKLAIIPAASIFVIMFISLLYLYMNAQNFDGIFLVFEDMFSIYINDAATNMTTYIASGFFLNVLTTAATAVMGYLLASAEEEY